MYKNLILNVFFPFALVVWLAHTADAAPTATEIVTHAHKVKGGKDSISRLTFSFLTKDGSVAKKIVYTMLWKDYGGKDGIEEKVVFIIEYPPVEKEKNYMAWLHVDKQNEEWMYLPEMRMVRKIIHSKKHKHQNEEDDFAHSVLTHASLEPRSPELDDHALLPEEELDGHMDYVVESIPRQEDADFPYQKTLRWINKETFVTDRIDYYNSKGEVQIRQTIKWKQIGEHWVWERVEGLDIKSGARTVLDISDIRLNTGLKDDVFSARTLRLGLDSIR